MYLNVYFDVLKLSCNFPYCCKLLQSFDELQLHQYASPKLYKHSTLPGNLFKNVNNIHM